MQTEMWLGEFKSRSVQTRAVGECLHLLENSRELEVIFLIEMQILVTLNITMDFFKQPTKDRVLMKDEVSSLSKSEIMADEGGKFFVFE